MATFLDLSLFAHLSGIFIFLFVFLIVYAFLHVIKIFKDVPGGSGIYAILALAIAAMASFSKGFIAVITTMAPWFTVLIIFLFLVFFVLRMFTTDPKFFSEMIEAGALKWTLVVVFVIILLVSLSSAFGQDALEKTTGEQSGDAVYNENGEVVYATQVTTPEPAATEPGVATNDFGTNMMQTLFHPKVLGMLLILLIAFFTILLIARTPEP